VHVAAYSVNACRPAHHSSPDCVNAHEYIKVTIVNSNGKSELDMHGLSVSRIEFCVQSAVAVNVQSSSLINSVHFKAASAR
jgi:hypothetical protein